MPLIRIVIGEDDTVLRDLCLRKFDRNKFDIATANNGQEAITKIETQNPDIVLLDLNMPDVDGFAVLQRFPRNTRSFPIIVLTNYDDQANRESALSGRGWVYRQTQCECEGCSGSGGKNDQ